VLDELGEAVARQDVDEAEDERVLIIRDAQQSRVVLDARPG
jgi:hypothetical protein